MSFPHIQIKTTNYELTEATREILEKRLATLERLLPKDEATTICEVELSKITEHHHAGKIYRVEVNLSFGGKLIRAEATEETIESAIDQVKGQLKTELRKMNDKGESLFRRGARRAKEMLRFGRY